MDSIGLIGEPTKHSSQFHFILAGAAGILHPSPSAKTEWGKKNSIWIPVHSRHFGCPSRFISVVHSGSFRCVAQSLLFFFIVFFSIFISRNMHNLYFLLYIFFNFLLFHKVTLERYYQISKIQKYFILDTKPKCWPKRNSQLCR